MPKLRTGAIVPCQECGKEQYLPPSELVRRKYCSRACQSAALEKARQRTCMHCGADFQMVGDVWGKYCSNACYLAARQQRIRTTCAVCGQPLQGKQAVYCSHSCRDTGRRTLEARPCTQCGTVMQVWPSDFQTKRFCSRACKNASLRITGPGARVKRVDGYIQVYYPAHPDATKSGWMLEHRLVAEQKYGRRILRSEHVNHINGVKDDNRPENVEVISPSAHARISNGQGKAKRAALRAELAEYRRRYGPLEPEG